MFSGDSNAPLKLGHGDRSPKDLHRVVSDAIRLIFKVQCVNQVYRSSEQSAWLTGH